VFFRVLGPVELTGQDGTSIAISAEKQRRLLAALLLRANTWVTVDYLVEAVWPDNPPKSTVGNVATYVHHLRGVIPPAGAGQRIESRRGAYRLRVERRECDATVFEDHVSAATAEPSARAVDALDAALALWRGTPYEPLTGAEVEAEAERLSALLWHTRYTLAEVLLDAGRAGDAITLLWPLTAEDPLREKTWEHLLRALSEDGRWAEVLNAFHRVRQVLVDELGVEPGPELRRMHELALRADEARPAQVTPSTGAAERTEATPSGGADRVDAAPARSRTREVARVLTRSWAAWLATVVASVATGWAVFATLVPATTSTETPDTSGPPLTFLSPASGEAVSGVITVRVRARNPAQLEQVDFHQLTSRCPGGGYKRYIGLDDTPSADGVYEITFDTRLAPNGCLDIGAVGLDRDDPEVHHPEGGKYVLVTVNNPAVPDLAAPRAR
jgi:DNA-binding SARP family transcriptional activator